jgi:Zn-dependent M28 family amino/carboxypeptidase
LRWLVLGLALAALFAWAVTTQPFVVPVPSQVPSPDEARLRSTVRHLSEALYPRSFDQPRRLAAAGRYVRDAFAAAGAKVEEQDVLVQGERFFNIVARFGPAQGPLLVVGAHYDSYGDAIAASRAGKHGPDTHTPGADDNASGVAALVELAHLLAQHPPARPVELVAYTLEEPPHFRTEHMGSCWHARGLVRSTRTVELMISLEMIGYFSDAEGSQTYPVPGLGLLYPTKGDFIAIVSRLQDWSETRRLKAAMAGASDLPVYSINTLPLVPGVDFSDHRCYWDEGIPAVMVTDTAFNRNAEYHGARDTFDSLDYRRMAKVVQGVYAYIAQRSRIQ